MKIPKVFISYSHDSQEHKKWVLELAIRLRNSGIDAIIDQFELKLGDDLPHFMETSLEKSDKVIMICSDRYVEKSNNGEGGVGYEKMIITSSLLQRMNKNKIIPIIRQFGESKLPTFLKSKLYINFSKNDEYEFNYDELVRTIHEHPLFEKPPVGNNPFTPVQKENLEGDKKFLNEVLKVLAESQGVKSDLSSIDMAIKLNISQVMFRIAITKLNRLEYTKWASGNHFVSVTTKGLMYAFENNLITE
jgi:hypothetical protein